MKIFSKALAKKALATVAAGAVAMTSASPVYARDRRDNDRIDAGDVIAGALIIGGIAAIASASNRDRRYDDRRYDDRYDYRGGGNSRQAVEQCVRAAERDASRYSRGGRAKVTDVRKIDRKRDGFRIEGRIAVNSQNRNWRNGDNRYGRGWDSDYRGWDSRYNGYDSGKFRCDIRRGRVVSLDFSGIRGL